MNPLTVARAYHDAWASHDFDSAIALLSPELEVEVPINAYPDKDSFARALADFGATVERVDLLSELAAGDEAVQLYDLHANGLGTMRVVEHFTVDGGLIVRVRQIHDTAALRGGYVRQLSIAAPPECVHKALTTLDGLAGWWTPNVSGTPAPGGELAFEFPAHNVRTVMRVGMDTPARVEWTCMESTHDEWPGTRLSFELLDGDVGTVLKFEHAGLIPALECYGACRRGWEFFLDSLVLYAETGTGTPYSR